MSLTISTPDLDALELAQTALLSPLDYKTTDTWRAVASARVAQLLGADQAVFTPPRTTAASARLHGHWPDTAGRNVAASGPEAGVNNAGLHGRVEMCHRWHLYRAIRGATELYVDWARPNRLPDIAFDPFPGDLFTCLHVADLHDWGPGEREMSDAFGERGLRFLRLLLPAFKTGVRTHLAFRVALAGMLDQVADGAAVWDRTGNCRYRNRALVELLATETERESLERKLADVARRMAAWPCGHRHATGVGGCDATLVTAANCYRLQATYTAGLGGGEPWVLVLVRPARHFPSAELLRVRYGLTPRQSEVARRLAEGQSDATIACALGISRRTAEHHAEAVRRSLGVRSRAALAAALQHSV